MAVLEDETTKLVLC